VNAYAKHLLDWLFMIPAVMDDIVATLEKLGIEVVQVGQG
jgi:hypothetical protein